MDKREESSGLRIWDLALVIGVATAIITVLAIRQGMPPAPTTDALTYVRLALGLAEFGTFGNFKQLGLTPALSYEVTPLYPAFVALLAKLDPALRASLICTVEHKSLTAACPDNYWTVVIGQGALMVVLAVSVWLTTWLISGRRAAAWLALVAVLACASPIYFARLLFTEALLLPLFGLFTLVLLLAVQRRAQIVWPLLGGVLLGLLVLTRPTFTYVFWFMLVAGIVIALFGRQWHAMRAGLAVFVVAYGVVILPWMARNEIQFGELTLADSAYGAKALSHRVGYNRMTAAEWGVAFIYWFPDFGDQLAKSLFPLHTYERLGWSSPKSFYQVGVRDVLVKTLEAAGSKKDHLNYLLRTEVFANPVRHSLVSLPLAWRGMFVDKYWGIIGWICCVWLLSRTARRREWSYWILCLPPFFLLAFHAAVSVSIPRYSVPLIPVLSLAIGLALMQLGAKLAQLKSRIMRARENRGSGRVPPLSRARFCGS